MIFVGDDWAQDHHDICVMDHDGQVLVKRRVPEGIEGIAQFHALVSNHCQEPSEVVVGIETDRGLFVSALGAAGYQVYAINPFSASRYRDRHSSSGAKSDPGDAKVLADLVRTDRHNHRLVSDDSELAEAIQVLTRSHQSLIWTRQRQILTLRSTLQSFYPAALQAFGQDLDGVDATAILAIAPTPEQGCRLSVTKIESALRRAGRTRAVGVRAADIQRDLRSPQLGLSDVVSNAFGATVSATVAVTAALSKQIGELQDRLAEHFEKHPDAEIISSLPGLGPVLGARVLAEFGDDPNRFANAKSRKNYAGTSPITRASGTKRLVMARVARNPRLADACYLWAFASLRASAGTRALYDTQRAKGATHHQALRAVSNRLVGILHGCVTARKLYDEDVAWPTTGSLAA